MNRRLSAGVEVQDGRAHARVWAPACTTVDFVLDGAAGRTIHQLDQEPDGFFSGTIAAAAGARYWFRLDADRLRPDPCSRFQPDGPHGPSEIVDPLDFDWTDSGWKGGDPRHSVIYEMHLGTYTPQGTWSAAAEQLPELAAFGITIVEVMPIADFPGRFGWGYDGVNLYAPMRLYGRPNDARAFVDRAHSLGLGVILDVVYNHLGPDGNYLGDFSKDYFTKKYENDWGGALNFEGPAPAREYFVENAGYWIDEYHFDGLRLDATQEIHDASPAHVLGSIAARARAAAPGRRVYVVAENEAQDVRLVRRAEAGGFGIDAVWNDDFHHAAHVALTGRREAYYTDYLGSTQELISSAKYGFLYQGQWYAMAEETPGHTGARSSGRHIRPLSSKPRSGREFGVRQADPRAHIAGPPSRTDCAAPARPRHAAAIPGAGVQCLGSLPVLRGPAGQPARRGGRGTQGVPVAIPRPVGSGRRCRTPSSGR